MAYNLPKPPGLSKEDSKKWDRRVDRYYKFMIWGYCIAFILFGVLVCLILYAKYIR